MLIWAVCGSQMRKWRSKSEITTRRSRWASAPLVLNCPSLHWRLSVPITIDVCRPWCCCWWTFTPRQSHFWSWTSQYLQTNVEMKVWFYTLHLGFCISMSTRKFIVLRRMWIHNRILKQRRSKLTSLISWGPLWRDTNPIYDVDNANLNNPNIFLWSHAANFVSYYLLNVILPYS